MEHKFSFKRLLSLLVVFTMLFSSFAMFAIPAGAEIFWAEGDYTIAENGNYSASHAYGYVFNVKAVNGTIAGEDAVVITNNAAYEASNPKWAAHVLFAPTEDANVYEIIKAIPYAGGSGAQSGYDQGINFENGNILLLVHSSASYPAYEADGVTLKYPNWESKVAAIALANTIGAKATLAGIDLEAGTVDNATVTIQKPEVEEPEDVGPYNYGLNIELSDNETLVIDEADAIELLTDGDWDLDAEGWGGTHDGVVLVQNKNATDKNAYGKANFIWKFEGTPDPYNTIKFGLYTDVNYMIGYPTEEDVYFSDDGENWVSGYYDLGYGETIPDAYTTLDGVEPTAPGTVVAEIRLEKPQTYKYVKIEFYYPKSPFAEKPRWEFFGLTEVFDFSYVEPSSVITDFNASEYWESRYGRGAGSFAFTNSDAYDLAYDNFIDSKYTQLAFAPVEGAENVYELVNKATGESAVEFPADGFVWVAYSAAPEAGSPCKAANDLFATMTIGETYEFVGIDFENGFGEKDAEVKKWEAPVEPEEPTPEETTNLIAGMKDLAPFAGNSSYIGDLTDGVTPTKLDGNNGEWFAFYNQPTYPENVNAPDGLGTIFIDLGEEKLLTEIKILTFLNSKWGINAPTSIEVFSSKTGEDGDWTAAGDIAYGELIEEAAWGVSAINAQARYVKVEVTLNGVFAMLSEVELYGADVPEEEPTPEEPTPEEPESDNVLLGVAFDKLTGTYYSYGSASTDGSELTDGYYITADNLTGSLYADDKVAGFGGLSGSTLELEGALDATYAIDKIVVYYANGKTGSGICEPATIKAFYKNGEGEWIQFGTTFESTETDDNMGTRYDFLISSVEFTVDTAVEATDIRFELTPRTGKTMVFISELEAWGTEVPEEPTPEEPTPEEPEQTITQWGSGAGVEVMTDYYTGVDEINTYDGFQDKLYGFGNSALEAGEYSFDLTVEESTYNTITLYALDFAAGAVMLPEAVTFVIDGVEYEATINSNEGGIATIVATFNASLTATEITVKVVMGASPYTFGVFNMYTEIETSFVLPEFPENITQWGAGADIEVMTDGYNGVGEVNNYDGFQDKLYGLSNAVLDATTYSFDIYLEGAYFNGITLYALDFANGGVMLPEAVYFVIDNVYYEATITPNAAGIATITAELDEAITAYGVTVVVEMGASPYTFPIFNMYTEIEFTYEAPGLPENITQWGAGAGVEVMTDGYNGVGEVNNYDGFQDKLYGFGNANLDPATYSFDLTFAETAFDTITLYFLDFANGGVMVPEAVKFIVNGVAYDAVITENASGIGTIVAELYSEITASEITVVVDMAASPYSFGIFNMFTEIELTKFVPAEPIDITLVEGENNITVPAGSSANATTNFDKDYVITITGQWGVTVFVNGVEYYPNRMGNLEAPLPAGENTVEFKNSAEEPAEIVAIVAAPIVGDTMDDPMILDEAGDYTASVDANYPQGVFYSYVATADGTLTLTITSEGGWTYVINNITAGIYGDTQWSDSDPVAPSTTINVSAGDEIAFIVSTYDPENPWNAPAGEVTFTLTEGSGEQETETVEVALGDVNMDGAIDQFDYILIKRAYFETIELNDAQKELADVNADGVIDQFDYILVKRHYFETFKIEGVVEVPAEMVLA